MSSELSQRWRAEKALKSSREIKQRNREFDKQAELEKVDRMSKGQMDVQRLSNEGNMAVAKLREEGDWGRHRSTLDWQTGDANRTFQQREGHFNRSFQQSQNIADRSHQQTLRQYDLLEQQANQSHERGNRQLDIMGQTAGWENQRGSRQLDIMDKTAGWTHDYQMENLNLLRSGQKEGARQFDVTAGQRGYEFDKTHGLNETIANRSHWLNSERLLLEQQAQKSGEKNADRNYELLKDQFGLTKKQYKQGVKEADRAYKITLKQLGLTEKQINSTIDLAGKDYDLKLKEFGLSEEQLEQAKLQGDRAFSNSLKQLGLSERQQRFAEEESANTRIDNIVNRAISGGEFGEPGIGINDQVKQRNLAKILMNMRGNDEISEYEMSELGKKSLRDFMNLSTDRERIKYAKKASPEIKRSLLFHDVDLDEYSNKKALPWPLNRRTF